MPAPKRDRCGTCECLRQLDVYQRQDFLDTKPDLNIVVLRVRSVGAAKAVQTAEQQELLRTGCFQYTALRQVPLELNLLLEHRPQRREDYMRS